MTSPTGLPASLQLSGHDRGRARRSRTVSFAMAFMTSEHLLTTTRLVRRRLDLARPVPRQLIIECVEIATQAPTASNRQQWH